MRNSRQKYFYPRSPCGERPSTPGAKSAKPTFLSTLPLRRATSCLRALLPASLISIHAPLAESDDEVNSNNVETAAFLSTLPLRRATAPPIPEKSRCAYFYPRSPCGERPVDSCISCLSLVFLSTLPLRRATQAMYKWGINRVISIHAPLAESDSKSAQNSGALLRI